MPKCSKVRLSDGVDTRLRGPRERAYEGLLPIAPSGDDEILLNAGNLAFRIAAAFLGLGVIYLGIAAHGAPFLPNPDPQWRHEMRMNALFVGLTASLIFLLVRRGFAELLRAKAEAAQAKVELVHRLALVAEWKDSTIGGHNYRIARSGHIIAASLGLSERKRRLIYHGAVLHDIGKVGMPDYLLQKSGPLTMDERSLMERHVVLGAAILDGSDDDLLTVARRIALTHHENWDGSGYPYGLQGEDIPIEGRIIAVCDVLDALLSRRPYKEPWEQAEAIRFVVEQSGRKFDPLVVDAMLEALPELLAARDEIPNDPWVANMNAYTLEACIKVPPPKETRTDDFLADGV